MNVTFVAKRATNLFFAPFLSRGYGILLAALMLFLTYPRFFVSAALVVLLAFGMVNGAAFVSLVLGELRTQNARTAELNRTRALFENSLFLFFRPLLGVVALSTLLAGVFLLLLSLKVAWWDSALLTFAIVAWPLLLFQLVARRGSDGRVDHQQDGLRRSERGHGAHRGFYEKWVSEAEQAPATCMIDTSTVMTPSGECKASELESGSSVISWNSVDRALETDRVVRVKRFTGKDVVLLSLSSRTTLCVTETHTVLSAGKWTTVRRLSVGDVLWFVADSGKVEGREVLSRQVVKSREVLSVETEKNDTLIVDGVISHNMTYFRGLRTAVKSLGEFRPREWFVGGSRV
ncbi:MAG: hypothetical protein KDI60_09030 [Xanthomonadales bacterium]|nr:hypothetical protein [Xanthomonadales bacterium]